MLFCKLLYRLFLFASLTVLVSCGGAGSEPSSSTDNGGTLNTGAAKNASLDVAGASINNLTYQSGSSLVDKTDINGSFEYHEGDSIRFTLGNYSFNANSNLIASGKLSLLDAFPTALEAVNFMRILEALDTDPTTKQIELANAPSLPAALNLSLNEQAFLDQFKLQPQVQNAIPTYVKTKLKTDCYIDNRCDLNSMVTVVDTQELFTADINQIKTDVDQVSVALMQAIVAFNSYVFLDPNHTPIAVIKQRQLDAIKAMSLLTEYATNSVVKTRVARANRLARRGYISDGLDVIQKNSLSAWNGVSRYFSAIKKASEDATFQLHEDLVYLNGSRASVDQWFLKAEDTAIFVKEASALSLTVAGTIYGAGVGSALLTSTAVAEAGFATTSALVVDGIASIDGIVSSASALIKVTKSGVDLFLGRGSSVAGYLSDNAVVNTIKRTDEVISMVSIFTPKASVRAAIAGAFSSVQYLSGQTTNLLYGNEVEFGDVSLKISEIPKTIYNTVVADHVIRAQINSRVNTAGKALLNAGRIAFNNADANLSDVLDLAITSSSATVQSALTAYNNVLQEAPNLAGAALLPGNYIDHVTLSELSVDHLDSGIIDLISSEIPDKDIPVDIKTELTKQKVRWNKKQIPLNNFDLADSDLTPVTDVTQASNAGCNSPVTNTPSDPIPQTGLSCTVKTPLPTYKEIKFYNNALLYKAIQFSSTVGTNTFKPSYSVIINNIDPTTSKKKGLFIQLEKLADGTLIRDKNLFYDSSYDIGYAGTDKQWDESGNMIKDINIYPNGKRYMKSWNWVVSSALTLQSIIIEETLLKSIGNNLNEPVYTTVTQYGNANYLVPSAPFEASLSIIQNGVYDSTLKRWHLSGNNLTYNIDGLLAARCQYDNSGQVTSYSNMYSQFEINNLASDSARCAYRFSTANVYSVASSTY